MRVLPFVTRRRTTREHLRLALTDRAYIVADLLGDHLDPEGVTEIYIEDFSYATFPHTRKHVDTTIKALNELQSLGIIAFQKQSSFCQIAAPVLRSDRLKESLNVEKLRHLRPDLETVIDHLLSRVKVLNIGALRRLQKRGNSQHSNTFVHESLPGGPDSGTFVHERKNQPEQNQIVTEKPSQPGKNELCTKNSTGIATYENTNEEFTDIETHGENQAVVLSDVQKQIGLRQYDFFVATVSPESSECRARLKEIFMYWHEIYGVETYRQNSDAWAEELARAGKYNTQLILEAMTDVFGELKQKENGDGKKVSALKLKNFVAKRLRDTGRPAPIKNP